MLFIATLALACAPGASAASPVLEFSNPGRAFPIAFTANGGEVTAEMAGFETLVHCTGSHGSGEITGPRSTVSSYVFTGCETQGGKAGGRKCKTEGAAEEEITATNIAAELVYINQAKHEVGMLLNPGGGVYMNFECGGEAVEASGLFLSPVGPINQEATAFTATLSRSGSIQTPNEYENESGEKLPAIPVGKRETSSPATTAVELSFSISTSVPLEIKAVTVADLETNRREEEAATAATLKKHQEEEAAATEAAKRHQEEAATAAAAQTRQEEAAAMKKRQEEEKAQAKQHRRAQLLGRALKQCRKIKPKHARVQCEKHARKKYGRQGKHEVRRK